MKKYKMGAGKIIFSIIMAILCVALIISGCFWTYVEALIGNMKFETVDEANLKEIVSAGSEGKNFNFENVSDSSLYHDDEVLNIVLLSLDNYQAEDPVGRSDSIILMSIDQRNKEIKMTSFMRDLYVEIPGYGFNRINAAYTFGGPPLTVLTLENNFRINIDRYVLIDYDKFVDIINTVGGVDIEITADEAQIINEESHETEADPVEAGMAHLTGRQARMYARIRKIDSDFQRTQRQRKVISALIDKMKKADLLSLNSYIADFLTMITTDMTRDEALGIGSNMMTYLNYELKSFRVPLDGGYYDYTTPEGAMVLMPNLEYSVEQLSRFIFGENSVPEVSEYTLPIYGGYYQGAQLDNDTPTSSAFEEDLDKAVGSDESVLGSSTEAETTQESTEQTTVVGYDEFGNPIYG